MQYILEICKIGNSVCWVRPSKDDSDISYINPKTKKSLIFDSDIDVLKALANDSVWNFEYGQQAYEKLYTTFYHFGNFDKK